MATNLRQAVRGDVPEIQRVRRAVKENRLTTSVVTDDDVVESRTGVRVPIRTAALSKKYSDLFRTPSRT